MTHPIHSADSLLADQVSVWRKEVARLNDLIAHAAGAPIHSADAERNDLVFRLALAQNSSCSCQTKTPDIAFHDSKCLYRVLGEAIEEISRAAAQVGAKGAADSIDTSEFRDLVDDIKQEVATGDKGSRAALVTHINAWGCRLAAGAPAETIEQARANFENWYVTHIDGAVIGSADCAARWSSWLAGSTGQYKAPSDWKIAPMPWGAPAETPKPVLIQAVEKGDEYERDAWFEIQPSEVSSYTEEGYEVRKLYATPAATIGAGEGKDAARVQFLIDHPHWSVRWRIQTKRQIQQWQMVDDGEPWGQWGEYRAVVDAARAAMRSKTSPGEAG